LLPDLADDPPPPMTTLAENNYFYATLAEVVILSGNWLDCWVTDEFRNFLADLVRGGIAVHLELEPLGPPAVERMLTSTEIPGAGAMAGPMHRFTGGNPLFVVETLKSLLEADEREPSGDALRDLLPERVEQVFDERFRRLDHRRLRFLRLLAVAQTDASAALVASALEMTDDDVAQAHAQLEEARLATGYAFRHDLVYEATRRSTPPAIQGYLHRRAGEALEALGGPAARVAYHFEQAGDRARALRHYLDAADDARVRGAFDAAADWLEQVLARDADPARVAEAGRLLDQLSELLSSH